MYTVHDFIEDLLICLVPNRPEKQCEILCQYHVIHVYDNAIMTMQAYITAKFDGNAAVFIKVKLCYLSA